MKDCRNNALPDYAFIEPPYVDQDDGTLAADQHPDNFVLAGDHFIRTVYEAIRSSDEVWRSTLFLIVWDEHGGIFDHVSPPTLPYGDSFRSALAGFNFDRLGVRVPAIVVSPYVTPGVSHTLFEHASIPATVTQQFIGPPITHARYLREQRAQTLQPLLIDMAPRMEQPDFGRPPRRSESSDDRVILASLAESRAPDRPSVRTDATGVVAADSARPRRASAPGVPSAAGRVRVRSASHHDAAGGRAVHAHGVGGPHPDLEGRDS